MTELWRLPATELAHLIRTIQVSAREAAESALQRLNAVNPQITHKSGILRTSDLCLSECD